MLCRHDRNRVTRDSVEKRHDHYEKEWRSRETFDRNEFDQSKNEREHRQPVIEIWRDVVRVALTISTNSNPSENNIRKSSKLNFHLSPENMDMVGA